MGAILSTLFFLYNKYQYKQETNKIIDEIFQEDFSIKTDEEIINQDIPLNEKQTKQEKIQLANTYLGYIEIPTLGIKNLITYGTDKNILNKGLVGLMEISANIDDEFGNIILAGHNINNVFRKLHYSKVGEEIKVVTHQNIYYYKITEKYTINDKDMSYFNTLTDKKILTLVTCENDSSKRLIIIAELIY